MTYETYRATFDDAEQAARNAYEVAVQRKAVIETLQQELREQEAMGNGWHKRWKEASFKLEKYRSILTGILERQSCAIEGGWELCEMCGYSVDNPPTDEDRADCLEIQIREALSDE